MPSENTMNLYPTSFYVWRATAGAYLYYEAVYDVDGNVVRFANKEPPAGFGSVHLYDEPFVHDVALRRGANRLRFRDLTEIGCVRHTTITDVGYGAHSAKQNLRQIGFTHQIREIPIMRPDNYAILPREMAATPAIIV
jgi:hypothetical protein